MTNPHGNTSGQSVDTPLLSVQQWKEKVPLLLDGRGRTREKLRRFVTYLADFADPDGTNIYPSVDRVAAHMHTTRRTVFRLYREAEQAKQIIREGHGPKGTIRVRLNMDLPMSEGWLPYDAAADNRRRKAAERWARYKANHPRGDIHPVVNAPGGDTYPVVEQSDNGVCVTQPSLVDHQKEDHQGTTDVAAAPPAGLDVIEGEIVEQTTGGELAVRADTVPAVPDLSASWLLPETEPTGKRKRSSPIDAPRFNAEAWQLPREPRTATAWVGELVALFVESCRGFDFEPSGRQVGQVGKEVRGLVAAGNNPVHILAAVRRAAEKRGAWIMRAMADVQPGNWSAQRPGRQIVTPQGVVQLPQGMSAGDRRAASIAAW